MKLSLLLQPSRNFLLLAVAAVLLHSTKVSADTMYVWAEEVGGNVVFYHEGSIDTSEFPMNGTGSASALIRPDNPTYLKAGLSSSSFWVYTNILTSIDPFGDGAATNPDSETGDHFGVLGGSLLFQEGYVSGSPLVGSMTFEGETFMSLGMEPTPQTVTTNVGDNTIFLFTRPPVADPVDNSVLKASLLAKIKKLQKKSKKLKKKGQKAKAKKLTKKVKKLKKQLLQLG